MSTTKNIRLPNRSVRSESHRAALSESLEVFLSAASRFPSEKRQDRPRIGAFTATEIVYHMVAVERLWMTRFRNLLTNGPREFQALNPDTDAAINQYNERPFESGLAQLCSDRNETLNLIDSLTDDQFLLSGLHSKYGEMTIERMLDTMHAHDTQHAAQLDRTARELESA